MKATTLEKSWFGALAMLLLLTMSTSIAHSQDQPAQQGQIFGALSTGGASGGSDAYLTTPDPFILPGAWSVALTATGSYPSVPFIEVGAIKNCGVTCIYNPYYSYRDTNGNGLFFE